MQPHNTERAGLSGLLRRWVCLLFAAVCCVGPFCGPQTALGEAPPPVRTEPGAQGAAPPAMSVAPAPAEVTELWTGSIFSSTYRVGVCFSAAGAVRGVVYLRLRNGEVDVYHIDGSVKDNVVKARHSSGHTFKGRLVAADRVEGVIHLKNGLRLNVEGRRIQGTPLTGDDCAPPAAD